MPDPLAPIHRLSFADLSPAGAGGGGSGGGVSGMVVNPVASTVYVHVQQAFVDPLAVAVACWPWWMMPLGVIVIAYIISRTRSVLARPQRRGVPHCRKCNYDLSGSVPTPELGAASGPLPIGTLAERESSGEGSTPPGFSPSSISASSSQCPECGRTLTPRTIVRGRSTPRRLAPLALPLAVLLAGAAIAVLLSLGWRPRLPAWPSPTVHHLADRLGVVVPNTFLVDCSTIAEADLATGATLRVVTRRTPSIRFFDITPTGDAFVMGGGPRSELVAVSTRTGRELQRLEFPLAAAQAVALTRATRNTFPVCGFTPDGAAAYVMFPDYGPPVTTSIMRWNLTDGSTSVLASVPTYRDAQSVDRPRRALILPGTTPRVLSWPGPAELRDTRRHTFEVRTGDGPPRLTVDLDPGFEDIRRSALTSDGSRLVLLRSLARDRQDHAPHFQLTQFSTADLRPLDTIDIPWRGITAYAASDPRAQFVAVASDVELALADTRSPSPLWTPLAKPDDVRAVPSVAFSSDGRYLVALASPSTFTAWRFELLVWEIASLRTQLPAPRRPHGALRPSNQPALPNTIPRWRPPIAQR